MGQRRYWQVFLSLAIKKDIRWSDALWLFFLGVGADGLCGKEREETLVGEVSMLCGEGGGDGLCGVCAGEQGCGVTWW